MEALPRIRMISSTQATIFFMELSGSEQAHFLVNFTFHLTIAARDTYAVQENGLTDPERMRQINEVQHRACGHAIALLDCRSERYPDAVLTRILLEQDSVQTRSDTAWAFEQAMRAMRHDS
jgi:hypothetical protein